ncbi:MAG: hypothetical protein OSJ59_05230, partial [Lachnospiraceae bacterium]|nr:hypothetical protein [Lachnospiraceae bacterium]
MIKNRTNFLNICLLFDLRCAMIEICKLSENIFWHKEPRERIRILSMAQGKITVKQQQILDYIKDEI